MRMSSNWLARTELLIGQQNIEKLKNAHVLVAGLGGVGGYAAEQLCRCGIGKLTLADSDVVQPSNRNRQLIALLSTESQKKADVFYNRFLDINPSVKLTIVDEYLIDESIDKLLETPYDYIIDAIDTLTPKIQLLSKAKLKGFQMVSSMGSGGKFAPEKLEIADISESHHCKFAYIIRKYLRKYGVTDGIKVVYSPEPVSKSAVQAVEGEQNKKSIVGTISYMPAVFGCFCASLVIRDLLDL
ncbi:MAG: tRNA threonylcarbamoyladenosine dehydratase [Bacteroidales bacterium]|nr:tRNA threonylcarbamoyladenosine dehydratase [Bacteroidales bacterium]